MSHAPAYGGFIRCVHLLLWAAQGMWSKRAVVSRRGGGHGSQEGNRGLDRCMRSGKMYLRWTGVGTTCGGWVYIAEVEEKGR